MAELTTTSYLVLKPIFGRYSHNANQVQGFTIDSIRKKRPTGRSVAGSVVLALKLVMPSAAFTPLRPEVTIAVPEGAYEVVPRIDVLVPEEDEG